MSNESEQVAGYVPSAEAVEEVARAICVAQNGDPDDTFEHPYTPAWMDYRREATAALSAAVPVEVARLLGEVRALADELTADRRNGRKIERSPFEEGYGEGHYDARVEAGRKLRAVLDTVGVPAQVESERERVQRNIAAARQDAMDAGLIPRPAQVDEAATGGQS